MKNRYWIGAGLFVLVGSILAWTGFGQSQSSVTLDSLNRQVQTLQTTVQNQERRIAALEQKVNQAARPSQPAQNSTPRPTAPATQRPGWHSASNWQRIQSGMSQQQVEAILGKPTKIEELVVTKKLFYEGQVAGSGYVVGLVRMYERRVESVEPPIF